MKWGMIGALLLALYWLTGCRGGGGSGPTVGVTISPTTATVALLGTQQFTCTVTGATDQTCTWSVNGVNGGNSTLGIITTTTGTTATYTAPGTLFQNSVTVTATSKADTTKSASATVTLTSSALVTVSPSSATLTSLDQFQFTVTVTNSINTAVTWQVCDSAGANCVNGGNPTFGSVTQVGLYTAPSSVTSQTTVTVKAVLQADSTRSGNATVTLVPPAAATLSKVSPTTIAQGSLFEDLYLTGANFLSTSTARVDNNPVPTTFVSSTILRARVPAKLPNGTDLLGVAGNHTVDVQQAQGLVSASVNAQVAPATPALVGTDRDSGLQNGGAFNVNFDGGYYSSSVTADFNEQVRPVTISSADNRKLSVALASQDLGAPGLFGMRLRNAAATPAIAATNLAVAPAATPSVLTTLQCTPASACTLPAAVAINTATGMAIVVNQGTNNVSLVDLTTNPPALIGAPIAVGNAPTGVAVDNLRNLALVVNNRDNSVSVIDLTLPTPHVTTTVALTSTFTLPFSIGVNPLTKLALVVYQNSSNATILDLTDLTSIKIKDAAVIATGLNPQVSVEPRLNWGVVTPGGTGSVSIVSLDGLNRSTVSTIAASSANGAVRKSSVVTIATTAAHGLTVGLKVTISGVTDATFNGSFTVASVPSPSTFTYAQNQTPALPDATSGNGSVSSAAPLVTVALNPTIQGIGLNTETERALLVDPVSTSVTFFSVLDQSVSTLALEPGHVAAAVNSLTNVGVSVNPLGNQASVIDLQTPRRLATLPVGSNPEAVAIDPASNRAVVVNQNSGSISVIDLGVIARPQVTQVSPPTVTTCPTCAPPAPLPDTLVTVVGGNFLPGAVVRLDETPIATTVVSARRLTATVPAASLAKARKFVLDVQNPGPDFSNVASFTALQVVPTGTGPSAVAIDPDTNQAVVANSGSNNATLIDLSTGGTTTLTVGKNPQGVAVLSRAGRAVVTNADDGTATVLDLVNRAVSNASVAVGTNPKGVAINPATGLAVVANSGTTVSTSQTLSFFPVENPGTPTSLLVDHTPLAVAVDPTRNMAAVTDVSDNELLLIDLAGPTVKNRITGFQLPTGVIYDPAADVNFSGPLKDSFLALSSLTNSFLAVDPDSGATIPVRVGINPTSIAYNYRSSTLVTVNSASQTISVMDFASQPPRVRAVLPFPIGSLQFSAAIHPRTNLAVIVDQTNNRVFLIPLPR